MISDNDYVRHNAVAENAKMIQCIHGKARNMYRALGHHRTLEYLGSRTEVAEDMAGEWLAEFREES